MKEKTRKGTKFKVKEQKVQDENDETNYFLFQNRNLKIRRARRDKYIILSTF